MSISSISLDPGVTKYERVRYVLALCARGLQVIATTFALQGAASAPTPELFQTGKIASHGIATPLIHLTDETDLVRYSYCGDYYRATLIDKQLLTGFRRSGAWPLPPLAFKPPELPSFAGSTVARLAPVNPRHIAAWLLRGGDVDALRGPTTLSALELDERWPNKNAAYLLLLQPAVASVMQLRIGSRIALPRHYTPKQQSPQTRHPPFPIDDLRIC